MGDQAGYSGYDQDRLEWVKAMLQIGSTHSLEAITANSRVQVVFKETVGYFGAPCWLKGKL